MKRLRKIKDINAKKLFCLLLANFGAIMVINVVATVKANACATMLGEYDIPEAVLEND